MDDALGNHSAANYTTDVHYSTQQVIKQGQPSALINTGDDLQAESMAATVDINYLNHMSTTINVINYPSNFNHECNTQVMQQELQVANHSANSKINDAANQCINNTPAAQLSRHTKSKLANNMKSSSEDHIISVQRLINSSANVDDAHVAGRITANSGVSFCISRNSVTISDQQASHNLSINASTGSGINSAVVLPAPTDGDVNMSRTAAMTATSGGMTVMFMDVGYKIPKPRRNWMYPAPSGSWNGASSGKQILEGITGSVAAGEMLALMGPSGSGKTSLLNIIGARHASESAGDANATSGVILYDGSLYDKSLKPRMGFVTQDDMLYPHLTVKETLTYAALLRLPAAMSRQEKLEKADQVIRQLGLERCRDTVIGNAFLRGVSGGERKRVCIGHEILIDPAIIFLDEPTSGLDSTTALRIMQLLRNLAATGRSIVTTIHQPSSRLFYLFDKLLLLAEGRCAYFGKAENAVGHFETLGFSPLVTMNPADFLLDLCCGNVCDMKSPTDLQTPSTLETSQTTDDGSGASCAAASGTAMSSSKDVVQYVVERNGGQQLLSKLTAQCRRRDTVSTAAKAGRVRRTWTTGWGTQVAVLLERGLKERRHEYLGWLKVTQVMATAFLCGSLWWHTGDRDISSASASGGHSGDALLNDEVGLLFFVGLFWGFFPLFNAVFTFPLERALLAKERASDMYRLSAYFVARTVSDLPLDLLLPTCFVTLVYFMAGLRMSWAAFSLSMMAVFLTVIAAQGVGLLIGAVITDVKKATTFGSVLVIACMLAGGYFVQHIPSYVAWLKYLSFQSYCYRLLLKIQFYPYYNVDICNEDGASPGLCRKALALRGALHGMKLSNGAEEVWFLLGIAVVSRLLAYLALRNVRMSLIWRNVKQYVAFVHKKHFSKKTGMMT